MNINAPRADSRLLTTLANTIASVFPNVYIVKVGASWNWLVIAGEHEPDLVAAADRLPEDYTDVAEAYRAGERVAFDADGEIFTDDWAPIEHMTDGMMGEAMLGIVGS